MSDVPRGLSTRGVCTGQSDMLNDLCCSNDIIMITNHFEVNDLDSHRFGCWFQVIQQQRLNRDDIRLDCQCIHKDLSTHSLFFFFLNFVFLSRVLRITSNLFILEERRRRIKNQPR